MYIIGTTLSRSDAVILLDLLCHVNSAFCLKDSLGII
jgi:hypothetical protein